MTTDEKLAALLEASQRQDRVLQVLVEQLPTTAQWQISKADMKALGFGAPGAINFFP